MLYTRFKLEISLNLLKVSVGPGKPNTKADVLLVQKLLNASQMGKHWEALEVDGVYGPKTAEHIEAYQTLVLGMKIPNGVVDPGERTIRGLLGERLTAAGPTVALAELAHQGASGEQPAYVKNFVKMALAAARAVKQAWGVPVGMVLAQAAFESGWGQQVKNSAYFGIKGKIRMTDGKRTYQTYANLAEAAHDYGRLLKNNTRYRAAFQYSHDSVKFVRAIAAGGRQTDRNNLEVLTRLIQNYGLDEFDKT